MKSGTLNLRMPPELHEQLSIEAAREGVSLNQWIVTVLLSCRDQRYRHLSFSAAERAIKALGEFVGGDL